MPRRGFSGSAVPTTITSAITNVQGAGTTFTIASATGWVFTYPQFVVVIDRGTASEEKMVCTISGTTLTIVQRAYDGTAAAAHSSSPAATILHIMDSNVADEANRAIVSARDYARTFFR